MTMAARRWRFVALGAVVIVTLAAGWSMVVSDLPATDDLAVPALLTGVAIVIVMPGLIGEWRRPGDPVAWLVVIVGVTTVIADFRLLRSPVAAVIGAAVFFAGPLLACDVVLRVPDGLAPQVRRRVVTACWVVPAALALGVLLVTGPRRTAADLWSGGLRPASWVFRFAPEGAVARWARQGNPLQVWYSVPASWALWAMWSLLVVTVAWVTAVAAARRCATGGPAERRASRLVRSAAIAIAVGACVEPLNAFPERARLAHGTPVGSVLQGHWYADLVTVAPALGAAALGTVLVWAELVRPRLGRLGGAIQLDATVAPSALGQRLQRALADPTARVLFPRDGGGWVDDRGRAAEPAARAGRAATIVTREGNIVAAVEHHDSLLAQPDLVDVAVASVGFALEAARLTAVARASTEDIQASATRLLGAAEAARRTVEHRIEAGPQRTLAAVSELLSARPVRLPDVHAGLRAAVAEVREIAHGIAPAGLVEDGLAAVLDDLAATAGVSLTVADLPAVTLPPPIEMTVFVVAQDAVRHAPGPLLLAVEVASASEGTADAVVLVQGWEGPVDQLVDDRVRTLGGTVGARDGTVRIALPLTG
jgi:hypothetical protein